MYGRNFSYAGGGYRPSYAPYSRQYSGFRGANNKPKKRSGCSSKKTERVISGDKKEEILVIYGWNLSKGGFVSFVAVPYRDAKISESRNGNRFIGYYVTLTNKTTKAITNCSGLYNLTDGKLIIKELGMVANPKTNYFGTFKRR